VDFSGVCSTTGLHCGTDYYQLFVLFEYFPLGVGKVFWVEEEEIYLMGFCD
jgi:hypothetical protein